MVVQEATAPPAEEVAAAEDSVPKIVENPSIFTVKTEPENNAEARDAGDTTKSNSGEITPSSARNEFIFSPQPPNTLKKSRSNMSKKSASGEAVEEPVVEEVAKETPKEEKTAPAEEQGYFTSFLEKATALCGTTASVEVVNEELVAPESPAKAKSEEVAPAEEGEDIVLEEVSVVPGEEAEEAAPAEAKSDELAPAKSKSEEADTKSQTSVLMSPIEKAKAAMSCLPQGDFSCQKDDLHSVVTDMDEPEAEEKDAKTAPADELVEDEEKESATEEEAPKEEEEPKEEEPKEEEPKEEEPKAKEPAPVVEAPKKKKMSMKKKISMKLKGMKKVIKGRSSKPAVVAKAEPADE